MPISEHTINSDYEYRIVGIVRKVVNTIEEKYRPTTGEELEKLLENNALMLRNALLDDIQEWMGFDELLKQVKGE